MSHNMSNLNYQVYNSETGRFDFVSYKINFKLLFGRTDFGALMSYCKKITLLKLSFEILFKNNVDINLRLLKINA